MGLRNLLHRLSVPIEELDEQRLRDFCAGRADAVPIGAVVPRTLVTVVGEVTSVRLVPRAGTAWLEATISDGRDRMVAM